MLGAVWALLTNVRFAVVQIGILVVAGLVGALVRQIPAFALHNPAAYQREIADLHQRYDPLSLLGWNFGPAMVDLFERIGLFRVFSAPWFATLLTLLVISIVCCTLNRLPRLWRDVHEIRIVQPEPFFDLRVPHRAMVGGTIPDPGGHGGEGILDRPAVREVLRRRHYVVREAGADGITFLYGDRNQYFRLSTLLTHAGLVLFLLAGAITGAFGFETVLFVADGQSAPVQPVGTPGNLLVKNLGFAAPKNPDGSFADFYSDIVVYREGVPLAQKRIRVNDPLEIDGFVFHQNAFGPAADLELRDAGGALLWTGPVVLDSQLAGKPSGTMTVPGSDLGLQLVLASSEGGEPLLGLIGYRPVPGTETVDLAFVGSLPRGAWTDPDGFDGYRISWTGVSAWTGMVVKNDPGQGIVWIAFLCLISGLVLTFYFPRRRAWTRLVDGRVQLVVGADRYVDVNREVAEIVEALRRRAVAWDQASERK